MTRYSLHAIILACSLWLPSVCFGQDDLDSFRPADTSSPRSTLREFIEATNKLHARLKADSYLDRNSTKHRPLALKILDCLDASQLPQYDREAAASEAALCLKEIIDRFKIPPYETIPGEEQLANRSEDETISRWTLPGTRLTIARIEDGPQRHEYLFSSGTVERAVSVYNDVRMLPYRDQGPATTPDFYQWYLTAAANPLIGDLVDRLPQFLKNSFWGQAIWKWVGLLLGAALCIFLMIVLYQIHNIVAEAWRPKPLLFCLTIVPPMLAAVAPLCFYQFCNRVLSLRSTPLYLVGFAANLIAIIASVVVVFGISTRIAILIIAAPRINPNGLDAQFIRIMSKIVGVIAAVVVLLEGGHYLGIPIATLVASAGIGGLALALAAQDSLRTLFGTLMLLIDKPFRVGERIVTGKYDGVVEEIGLRSTRLRLLTGHQVSIPNDELARSDIENVGRRPHIRRLTDIRLPLITTQHKITEAIELLRSSLENHEGMTPEYPPRITFLESTAEAHVIRVIYWYSPPKYWDYLAFGERWQLDVLEKFENHGICLAVPIRVTGTTPLHEEVVSGKANKAD